MRALVLTTAALLGVAAAQTTPSFKLAAPGPAGKPCVLKAGVILQGQGGAVPAGLKPACESRIQQFAYLIPGTVAAEFYWGELKHGQTLHAAFLKSGFKFSETIKGARGNVNVYHKGNKTLMLTLQSFNDQGTVKPLISLILVPKE